jgi:hypothetical protein
MIIQMDTESHKDVQKMKKIIFLAIIIILAASVFMAVPVVAKGPVKSNNNKVINLDPSGSKEWWIIFTKRGWRQWQDTDGDGEVDRFANVLFSEGMTEEAIQDHLDDGWHQTEIGSSDLRYPYITDADLDGDNDVGIIWQYHDIPSE